MLSPLAFIILLGLFPVPFVRMAGCSGTVEGAWLDGAKRLVVVPEHVWASAEESYLYTLTRVRSFDVKTGAEQAAMFGQHFTARGVHDDVLWGQRDEALGALDLRTGGDPFASGKLEGIGEQKQLRGAGQAFISAGQRRHGPDRGDGAAQRSRAEARREAERARASRGRLGATAGLRGGGR